MDVDEEHASSERAEADGSTDVEDGAKGDDTEESEEYTTPEKQVKSERRTHGDEAQKSKDQARPDETLPSRVEVKEENVKGDDYLMAKGRLQGVLKLLIEQSSSDSEDDDDRPRRRDRRNDATPVRSTYLMKLYDRSVDLAKFDEDTPLYPICRAWMANNSQKQSTTIVKRRLSSPDPESQWGNNLSSGLFRLPPPNKPFITRIPSPTPEQASRNKHVINLNYDENPPIAKNELLASHLQRWGDIKRKWIHTSAKNEERYSESKQILKEIYAKAHEMME